MKVSTIIIIIFIFCQNVSIGETMTRDIDAEMAEIVVKYMIRQLPETIKKICVMEIDFKKSSKAGAFFKFKKIDTKVDKRIEQNSKYCDGHRDGKLLENIYYSGNINDIIDELLGPNADKLTECDQDLSAYNEFKKYISQGYIVILSQTEECGSRLFGFVFRCASLKVELIKTIPVGTVECFQKNS